MKIVQNDYILPTGNSETFNIVFKDLELKSNYYQESRYAAESIKDQSRGKLYLMYSGGVDSEYAFNVFLNCNIQITPVIIKLSPYYNDHDISYALNFCDSKNIRPIIIDIDFDDFIESGKFLDISREIRSSVHHRAATAYAIGKLDGVVICGDGEPYIRINDETKQWNVTIYEHDYAVYNYYKKYSIDGTPHFNRYSEQMFSSFLLDQRMIDLANNTVEGKISSNSSKYVIYNRHADFVIPNRPKYHGYEKIEESKIFSHESFEILKKESLNWNGVFETNYFEFIKKIQ
jgi:hypothetical protein